MIWDYIGLESELIPDIVFGINSKDVKKFYYYFKINYIKIYKI